MKKYHLLLTLCAGLSITAISAVAEGAQEFLNSIHAAIEQAVGAKIPDQIPGYSLGKDNITLDAGGIECPKEISDVNQAADLLKAKLSTTFTNRMISIRRNDFPPGDDTVLVAKFRDESQEVVVSVTIFKRSSSRVILFPVMLSKSFEK